MINKAQKIIEFLLGFIATFSIVYLLGNFDASSTRGSEFIPFIIVSSISLIAGFFFRKREPYFSKGIIVASILLIGMVSLFFLAFFVLEPLINKFIK